MSGEAFKPGDLVRLRSGGPVMTIAHWSEMNEQWSCRWFDGPKHQAESFPSEALERVDRAER
jgi:uncharacterized protein YodC (DUF2158 family)